jgi:Zn-dependent peptidase ImmA (M78 family)
VPEYRGTRASGAARWITPNLPTIQLSYRYKREDVLWFSLFHEAGHLLRHGKKDTYISEPDLLSDTLEDEADAFARDTLIPPTPWARFIEAGQFGEAAIVEAAKRWEIDPGIVVGRLKKEKRLDYNRLGHLHRTVEAPHVS